MNCHCYNKSLQWWTITYYNLIHSWVFIRLTFFLCKCSLEHIKRCNGIDKDYIIDSRKNWNIWTYIGIGGIHMFCSVRLPSAVFNIIIKLCLYFRLIVFLLMYPSSGSWMLLIFSIIFSQRRSGLVTYFLD